MIAFSSVAAVAVLALTANLTVDTQRRSYALWQLANMKPRLVRRGGARAVGSCCGAGRHMRHIADDHNVPSSVPVGIRRASGVRAGSSSGGRSVDAFCVARGGGHVLVRRAEGRPQRGEDVPPGCLARVETEARGNDVDARPAVCRVGNRRLAGCRHHDRLRTRGGHELVAVPPPSTTAGIAAVGPLAFAAILKAWTSVVPQSRWNAWYVARHTARFGLSASTSVETPIMVGFGLVAGIFSS